EVSRFFVSVGGFGGGQVNSAMMFVTLKEEHERDKNHLELMDVVRKELGTIKGLRVVIQDLSQRAITAQRGFPIEFTVSGPDWDKIVEIVKDIEAKMIADNRFTDVDTNYDEGSPEIRIRPNRDQAAALGVSVEDISRTIGYLIGGQQVARFTEGGKRLDIRVQAQ